LQDTHPADRSRANTGRACGVPVLLEIDAWRHQEEIVRGVSDVVLREDPTGRIERRGPGTEPGGEEMTCTTHLVVLKTQEGVPIQIHVRHGAPRGQDLFEAGVPDLDVEIVEAVRELESIRFSLGAGAWPAVAAPAPGVGPRAPSPPRSTHR